MFRLKRAVAAGVMTSVVMTLALPGTPMAAPMPVVGGDVLSPGGSSIEVRYRRPARRNNAGPAAFMGLFGAVLGGVIASSRYDNYSNYAYGQPVEYGYAPGYVQGRGYGGDNPGGSGRLLRGVGGGFHGRAGAVPAGHGMRRR